MKTKEVNNLINSYFKGEYYSGWYGFRISCDLHQYGNSNMSPMSKQEYCNRIPKKTVKLGDQIYKKGEQRPSYESLHCNWKICPRLKEMFKSQIKE